MSHLQDGTLETGIPSPELFPIHHLDELEFFPGDFVIESKGMSSIRFSLELGYFQVLPVI